MRCVLLRFSSRNTKRNEGTSCLILSAALSPNAGRKVEARGSIYRNCSRKRAIGGRVTYGFTQTPFQAPYCDATFRKVIHHLSTIREERLG